ncbi:SPFH domain-containing protein [Phenylobacterium sp.]|jgi:regulator of protease activity HflC (stomatin/prohibitin superfamily)|uniref:SPFH domain-containing protein n=1 Tax=Phenylobacterium sp. TaxID=1871053 RepID=UPI002F3F1FF0
MSNAYNPGVTFNLSGYRARTANGPATLLAVVFFALGALSFEEGAREGIFPLYGLGVLLVLLGLLTPLSLKVANQWERAVVLRLGKLQSIQGPGVFFIVPVIDEVSSWLDQRIQTTEFNAEQALSKDTVPVDVDAVVFWQIHDAERAALEITDYRSAIARVSQTSLREMVGSSLLSTLLSDRKRGDELLREEIGRKTADWGVTAISVEIRDIGVPTALQDAMSREAQAQREAAARIHLGQAEQQVAQKFVEAAEIYAQSPAALQLRAMNIIYETTKERGATILMPTAMVDAMNPGGVVALAGLAASQTARPDDEPKASAAPKPLPAATGPRATPKRKR